MRAEPPATEMDRDFWLERWRLNQIGFHQAAFNARLVTYWPKLALPIGAPVFVPLCGKSRDMVWLAGAGHPVIGVELSSAAIEAFFDEAGAPHTRRQQRNLTLYRGGDVSIYCCDFFDLTPAELIGVRGVFDRGALVALPPGMRRRYVEHLLAILPARAEILLLTIEYDQNLAPGPPFSVPGDEVMELYTGRCSVELLERTPAEEMPPRFQALGIREAGESTYRIVKEH
jgi:thiopurine S-methyltransferase